MQLLWTFHIIGRHGKIANMGKINQKIGKFHYNDIEIYWGKFILINQLAK